MKDVIFDDFQNSVDESLIRHRSVLDILTKLQESNSRINRAVAKTVTNCGCIQAQNGKLSIPEDADIKDIKDLKNLLNPQVEGSLCDNCRSVIENEMGNHLFYMASLCNLLGLNLYDILLKEYEKIDTLGKYSFR